MGLSQRISLGKRPPLTSLRPPHFCEHYLRTHIFSHNPQSHAPLLARLPSRASATQRGHRRGRKLRLHFQKSDMTRRNLLLRVETVLLFLLVCSLSRRERRVHTNVLTYGAGCRWWYGHGLVLLCGGKGRSARPAPRLTSPGLFFHFQFFILDPIVFERSSAVGLAFLFFGFRSGYETPSHHVQDQDKIVHKPPPRHVTRV